MSDLVVRHLVDSTLVCLLLGFIASCLRRQRAATRHSLWLIAVSKFLIPTFLLTATGAQLAFALPASAWLSSIAAQVSALLVQLFGHWPAHVFFGDLSGKLFVLLAVWLLGSVTLFAMWCIRLRGSYRDIPASASKECDALVRAKQRLRFAGSIKLCFSDRVKEPTLMRLFHPAIVIPNGVAEALSDSEFQAVLLHELAHARRLDNLVSAIVHSIVCLFWFHPLLWFAESQLISASERACDEAVVQSGITPEAYVAGISKVCRFRFSEGAAGMSAIGGSNLKSRFDHILTCGAGEPIPYIARVLLAAIVAAAAFLPIAGGYCEQCSYSRQANPNPKADRPLWHSDTVSRPSR